jgi:hypothetical protein
MDLRKIYPQQSESFDFSASILHSVNFLGVLLEVSLIRK